MFSRENIYFLLLIGLLQFLPATNAAESKNYTYGCFGEIKGGGAGISTVSLAILKKEALILINTQRKLCGAQPLRNLVATNGQEFYNPDNEQVLYVLSTAKYSFEILKKFGKIDENSDIFSTQLSLGFRFCRVRDEATQAEISPCLIQEPAKQPLAEYDQFKVINAFKKKDLPYQLKFYPEFYGKSATQLKKQLTSPLWKDPPPKDEKSQLEDFSAQQSSDIVIPSSYDPRVQNPNAKVWTVDSQNGCSACWAFAAAGLMSTRAYHSLQVDFKLSIQEIISCDLARGSCNGGSAGEAVSIMEQNPRSADWCLPYAASTSPSCYSKCQDSWKIGTQPGSYNPAFAKGSPDLVKVVQQEILLNGPVIMFFVATNRFMQYGGGVYVEQLYPGTAVDHSVPIIGWGTDSASGLDYWLVKNSWGSSWGENGYFRIKRGTNELNGESLGFLIAKPVLAQYSNCSSRCEHNGEMKLDCTCYCYPPWGGPTCSVCSVQCQNGGKPSTSGCLCTCPEGYYGDFCQNMFITDKATYSIRQQTTSWWYSSSSNGATIILNYHGTYNYGDQLLFISTDVNPLTNTQWKATAVYNLCGTPVFPFRSCPGPAQITGFQQVGSFRIWRNIYLGAENGQSKGFQLDPISTPPFTVQ